METTKRLTLNFNPIAPKKTAIRRPLFLEENTDEGFNNGALVIDEEPKRQNIMLKKDLCPEDTDSDYNICELHIGGSRYVVVKEYREDTIVHIRNYLKSANKLIPTKEGICLDLERWLKIQYKDDSIDELITQYKSGSKDINYSHHLGRNYYLSIKSGYPVVDIRKWFMPFGQDTELKPTRRGIALTFNQWANLKKCGPIVKDLIPKQLSEVTFCELSEDHQNQEGAMRCPNCNPNGHLDY